MTRIALTNWTKYALYTTAFLSFFIVPFLLFGHSVELSARRFFIGGSGDGAAMVAAAILLGGDPVLPTPSSVVATLLAAKVGFVRAAIVNGAALSFACLFGYALGRGGGAVLARSGHGLPPRFADWVRRHGLVAVLLCRPVPVLAEASLMIAGATRHKPHLLLAACCATQMLLGMVYAYAGSGWGQGRWESVSVLAGAVLPPIIGAFAVWLFSRSHGRRPAEVATARTEVR